MSVCSVILFPVLVSVNLQFIQQAQDSAVLWFPHESLSKTDALLATSPLVTKQKIRIDASNANQEPRSQSKLIRVNCKEFQVVEYCTQMVSVLMECTVRGYSFNYQ